MHSGGGAATFPQMKALHMARQTEDIDADWSTLIRLGTVKSVDLAAAKCIVVFGDPDDEEPSETPPIRWLCGRAGRTRVWSPPSVGEQVILLTPDAQIGAAVALTGIVQNAFPPAGSDEIELIEFADGARISYDAAAHALAAQLPDGATAAITASGGITLTGDVTINGTLTVNDDVTVNGKIDATGDVTGDGISLSGHKHGGVQAGGAKTAPPE